MDDVFDDPDGIAAWLIESKAVFGLTNVEVRFTSETVVCFWLTIEPWLEPAAAGYPTELVAVTVGTNGDITAVPNNTRHRQWLHRNLAADPAWWGHSWWRWFASAPRAVQEAAVVHAHSVGNPQLLGSLCLWYPEDPPGLQWRWAEGLVAYITIVHRHVQAEEFWRRTGHWPAEDAPHGAGHHPIQTAEMLTAATAGAA